MTKGTAAVPLEAIAWGDVFFQQPLPVEWSTFPLSSRAKSRDLRFNGPLVECFVEEFCSFRFLRHTYLAGRSELGSTFSRCACSSHSMIDWTHSETLELSVSITISGWRGSS
jgi:hypothetical protein